MGSHFPQEEAIQAEEVTYQVESGDYLAVPFDHDRGWGPLVAKLAADFPHWISAPSTVEEREQILYGLVSNPMHLAWEVWDGTQIVGIILLTDIAPLVDARLHFAFFDHKLVGKTPLLRRFLAYCFQDLRFQRISIQVPEFFGTLLHYYQRKLKFRFEGEAALEHHQSARDLGRVLPMLNKIGSLSREELEGVMRGQSGPVSPRKGAQTWIASQGSRREHAHWHEGTWYDVFCLRLLASEYLGETECLGPPMPMAAPHGRLKTTA